MASQLTRLFEEVGVPSEFRWEPGDWDNDPDTATNASNRGDDASHAMGDSQSPAVSDHATGARGDGGGGGGGGGGGDGQNQNQNQKRPKDLMGALKVNDKLFEAIAAVPWIPEPDGGAVYSHMYTLNLRADLLT